MWSLCVAALLLMCSCSHKEENSQQEPKSQIKEAVKDVVTQDFKVYQGAKDSLKQSEEKHKSELEQIDKESQ
jgi:hypothetical protein